jgi:hypothetical protein
MIIKLESGNEYRKSKIDQIERIRKNDRLKGNLSQRINFGSAITILDMIAKINVIIKT